jgi:elongation factor Ts
MTAVNVTAEQVKELRERTGAGMMDCRTALAATGGDINAAIETRRREGSATADKKAGRTAADGMVAVAAASDAVAMVEVNCETDFVARREEFQAFANAVARAALQERPATLEALAGVKAGAQTVEDLRTAAVQKTGENITLRRFELVQGAGGPLAQYIHAGSRIGVVVALEKGDAELGRDIAMHIAAQRPQYLQPADVPAAVQDAERKVIAAQTAEQAAGKPADIVTRMVEGKLRKFLSETTLLGQAFVKDPDQTVEKVLAARGGAVARFVRFEVCEGIDRPDGPDFAGEVAAMIKPKH